MNAPLITAAGAYSGVTNEDYHRHPNLLPAPSLSASGAKKLLGQSPFHFWFDSPMNPERPPEEEKSHFNIGKAAHDMILLSERWPEAYHCLPDGFAWNKTKAMPEAIAEAEAARDAGKTLLKHEDAETVRRVAAAIGRSTLAKVALTNGEAEVTLAWQDPETGVWLRARPDFLPAKRQIVSDLKFMAPTYCSPEGFRRAIANNGYHMSAALYADGIKAIFGEYPANWLHVVVEKEPPHCVALYELPGEDIERGRWLNRKAIRRFAECLSSGKWPGYADEPLQVGLPGWNRKAIDDGLDPNGLAWAAAA